MNEAQIVSGNIRRGPPHLAERPDADEYAAYYVRYVDLVPAGDITQSLEAGARETAALLRSDPARERADFRYAPGKWSVKEVLAHVTDAERVFAYRLLRFARGDDTPLSIAFADPVLRAEGLADDSYGAAKRFFGLSDGQLHYVVCSCHCGATMLLVATVPMERSEVWFRAWMRVTSADGPSYGG